MRGYKSLLLIVLLTGLWLGFTPAVLAGPSAATTAAFTNPLGTTTTFSGFIIKVTQSLLGLVGFLAMASLVWGGTLYIISLGNDNYVQQAKKIILWAVIGLIVIILSFVIIKTVQRFLGVTV